MYAFHGCTAVGAPNSNDGNGNLANFGRPRGGIAGAPGAREERAEARADERLIQSFESARGTLTSNAS